MVDNVGWSSPREYFSSGCTPRLAPPRGTIHKLGGPGDLGVLICLVLSGYLIMSSSTIHLRKFCRNS